MGLVKFCNGQGDSSMSLKIPLVNDFKEWAANVSSHGNQKNFYSMYSSWSRSIVTNPLLMNVPIDDHLVHRGDGVFEAFKCVEGRIYLLREHLARLQKSMEMVKLVPPFKIEELEDIIKQTCKASGQKDILVRTYVSRGPGGFGVDPKESVGSQFYVVCTALKLLSEEIYLNGVKACIEEHFVKDGVWSQIKSCNYLPNVMMKDRANQKGAFLAINVTEKGEIGEGSTENILVHDKNGDLVFPPFDYTLRGTMLLRLVEILKKSSLPSIKKVVQRALSAEDLFSAQQVMAVGTTLDVLSISSIEGKKIGDGTQSETSLSLRKILQEDYRSASVVLTPI